jgi:hypothetical protein
VSAPGITVPPSSLIVAAGNSATFTVSATGEPPPAYQWRKNGAKLNGATQSSYQIPRAQAAEAGIYSVAVSNVLGGLISSNATLTVDGQSLTLTLTAPISGQRWSNAVFRVKGTARDNVGLSSVWCLTNGVWGEASATNAWTNWWVDAALAPGTNLVTAYAVDEVGNRPRRSA